MSPQLRIPAVPRRAGLAAAGIVISTIVHAASAAAADRPAPPAAVDSPVLSTTPTPPAGVEAVPAQMSGMPLQVGDLPPGTVSVRVIRRRFSDNIANQPVELELGTSGRTLKATTDAAGRAIFSGLVVGEPVAAQTLVDGELLRSQHFNLPPEGGVRLVLVAGVAAEIPSAHPAIAPAWVPASGQLPPTETPGSRATTYVWVIPPALAFIVFGAGIWVSRRRPRAADTSRDVLFDALVHLEQQHDTGGVTGLAYSDQRDQLIAQLVQIETAKRSGSAPAVTPSMQS